MSTTSPITKVLQICNHYEAPFLDVTRQYAALFDRNRVEVITVFLRGEPSKAVESVDIGQAIYLNLSKEQVLKTDKDAVSRLKRLNDQHQFSFCIAHRHHSVKFATTISPLPIFAVFHGFGSFDRLGRRLFINQFKKRITILAVSNALRDEIRQRLPRWPHNKIITLHNHVDVAALKQNQLSKEESRQQLGLDQNAFIISNVGRLHPDKDQKTLVDGFAKASPQLPPNSQLIIYGKGRLESQLQQQIKALGLEQQVILGGFINNLPIHFKAFDIFALSSDHEPFGMVLLEAMAAEVPIIATNCGGACEVVEADEQLFSLGQYDELAQKLIHMANLNNETRKALIKNQSERLQLLFSDEAAKQTFLDICSQTPLS